MNNLDTTYDLVVIGGGSGGLSAVGFGIEMGARVALVEKKRVGGDCTWTGCIPSKSFLKAAKVAHHMRTAGRYGVKAAEPEVDLESVMIHVHDIVEETYAEETPEVLRSRGVDVYIGAARFSDLETLVVGETSIKARKVVLTTGAHPFIPPIEGLDAVNYVTYETVWDMKTLPRHLIVIGGGPVGSELAQGFRRLGAEVTMLASRDRLLPRDDRVASRVLGQVFEAEGIDVRYKSRAERAWQNEQGIHVAAGGDVVVGDALLVTAGRRPNVQGLDLEKAGIKYSERGIRVDDKLRTSQNHIYAAGDCIGHYQFTHYAGYQAVVAARNALLPGASGGMREWVPWTTFTDPEIAHAGLTEERAREKLGDDVVAVEFPMERVDRPRAEVDTEGLVYLVTNRGGRILGVTVAAERAGEIIHEWMLVLEQGVKVRDITTMIHVYPTYSRANVKAGGKLLQQQLLSGWKGDLVHSLGRWMLRLMRWMRGF